MSWRYIAQRIAGPSKGTFLDWNLPLIGVEITESLGTDWLTATIDPQIDLPLALDGRPLLDKWSTAIWAEEDGLIRGGGILVENVFTGPERKLDVMGYSGYPHGLPWNGEASLIAADPLAIAKLVWAEVQKYANGNLGLVVTTNTSPVRLGIPGVGSSQEVFLGGKWVPRASVDAAVVKPSTSAALGASILVGATSFTVSSIAKFASVATPFDVTVGNETITVGARNNLVFSSLTRGVGTSVATGHNKGTPVKYVGTPVRIVDPIAAEPFRLSWWEAPDCGAVLDSLNKETPFGQKETHAWVGDVITHQLEYRYPRMGKRRADLRFVRGENITNMPTVSDDGTYFANEVLGLGAGTGRAMKRASAAVVDNRLRRVHVLIDNAEKSVTTLKTKSGQSLVKHSGTLSLSTITVQDHPNARIGSWEAGDEILIQADLGWMKIAQWCRVLSTKIRPDNGNEAEITLEGLSE